MQISDNLSVSLTADSIPTPFVPSGHFPLIGGIGPWKGSLGISCFPDGDGNLGDEFFGVVRQAVVDQGDLAGEAVRREEHAVVL